jgi:5'-nucleotidase
MSFHKDIEIKKVNAIDGVECYSVSGTPADCVKFALNVISKKFDLVVSGINGGPNLGSDINYSGTVNACFEANVEKIPAIAFSNIGFKNQYLSENAKVIETYLNLLLSNVNSSYTLNVNIPNVKFDEVKGYKFCSAGVCRYTDGYIKTDEDTYRLIGEPIPPTESDFGTDVYYTYNGYVTITPVTHRVTDYNALEKLKDLNK